MKLPPLRPVGSENEPLGVRLFRTARLTWRQWRRNRERACIRCGAPAAGECAACGAKVCAECTVLSSEIGATYAICRGCSGDAAPLRVTQAPRRSGWEMFRSGAVAVVMLLGATVAWVAHDQGWSSALRVFFSTLHPAILFGLVPLALVLGAALTFLRRLLDR